MHLIKLIGRIDLIFLIDPFKYEISDRSDRSDLVLICQIVTAICTRGASAPRNKGSAVFPTVATTLESDFLKVRGMGACSCAKIRSCENIGLLNVNL